MGCPGYCSQIIMHTNIEKISKEAKFARVVENMTSLHCSMTINNNIAGYIHLLCICR